jgi:hypothetical protein
MPDTNATVPALVPTFVETAKFLAIAQEQGFTVLAQTGFYKISRPGDAIKGPRVYIPLQKLVRHIYISAFDAPETVPTQLPKQGKFGNVRWEMTLASDTDSQLDSFKTLMLHLGSLPIVEEPVKKVAKKVAKKAAKKDDEPVAEQVAAESPIKISVDGVEIASEAYAL